LLLARDIDAVDQILDDRARRKRHEAHRRAERDLVAKERRPSQRQDDARRIDQGRVVHVLDVGQRDAFLLAAVFHHQCLAVIPDLVDEVECELFHHEITDENHDDRHNQKWKRRRQI
jgi:hypothetical protein